MDNGWIKLHRRLMEWEWYTEPYMVQLLVHLVLLANHEERKWKGQLIRRGQVVTGRHALSEDTGISERSIRTCLQKLKNTGEVTIQTTNRFSIITLNNYEKYQLRETRDQPTVQQTTSDRPATDHKQELQELKELQEQVVPKSLARWLRQQGKGDGYGRWLCQQYGSAVEAAWEKVLGGKKVHTPGEFVELCKTLAKE